MVLWDSHGNIWGYPLAICSIAIENDTVIVDLPIKDGDFPQLCYICLPFPIVGIDGIVFPTLLGCHGS